jgi:hypothetical protein
MYGKHDNYSQKSDCPENPSPVGEIIWQLFGCPIPEQISEKGRPQEGFKW